MTNLYTKNGRLRRDGDRLFARSGIYVGRIKASTLGNVERRGVVP